MFRMDSNNDITRMNVEDDRLSSLPDDLIQKIFSFIGLKYAIKMTSLSSRWRFFWTSLPYVNFATEDFSTMLNFSMFVYHAMSRRNTQIQVFSVNLIFRGKVKQLFVKRILRSVLSLNVKQLIVTSFRDRTIIEYPLSFLSSQSLKHLISAGSYMHSVNTTSTWELASLTTMHLENVTFYDKITNKTSSSLFSKCANLKNLTLKYCSMKRSSTGVNPKSFIIPMSALEFPSLTTLHLHFITLCDESTDKGIGLFSKCANLKNLTLSCFKTMESNGFTIRHPRLSNLTLHSVDNCMEAVNVVAPHLENLTIRNCRAKHMICAPNLASFFYKGGYP